MDFSYKLRHGAPPRELGTNCRRNWGLGSIQAQALTGRIEFLVGTGSSHTIRDVSIQGIGQVQAAEGGVAESSLSSAQSEGRSMDSGRSGHPHNTIHFRWTTTGVDDLLSSKEVI